MTLPPLTPTQLEDKASLEKLGFIVGVRDPKMNTAFLGKYMVSEHYEENHTQVDGGQAHSVWCIVGDNLALLIEDAASFWGE